MNRSGLRPTPACRLGDSPELEGHVAELELCTEQWGPCHPRTLAAAKSLAVAFWRAGYTDQAISLLDQALDRIDSTLGPEHPLRAEFLGALREILLEQGQWEQAGAIQRELLECCIRRFGPHHSTSLEAKGDLAAVLYELGQDEEASRLEQEALEGARAHLGKTHAVTCVLAWNRAMNHERGGDLDSARTIVVELAWLLTAESVSLEPDQHTIRDLLERRVNWERPPAC